MSAGIIGIAIAVIVLGAIVGGAIISARRGGRPSASLPPPPAHPAQQPEPDFELPGAPIGTGPATPPSFPPPGTAGPPAPPAPAAPPPPRTAAPSAPPSAPPPPPATAEAPAPGPDQPSSGERPPDSFAPPPATAGAPAPDPDEPAAEQAPDSFALPPIAPDAELPAGSGRPSPASWLKRYVIDPGGYTLSGSDPAPSFEFGAPVTGPDAPDRRELLAQAGSRYANASIADAGSRAPWSALRPIGPSDRLILRVDIGPRSDLSQVTDPVPFPDDRLPDGDLEIDVVVSSSSFTVGRDPGVFPADGAAEDSFILPGDGGPARTRDGGTVLSFVLGAPATPGTALLRIVYYYRGAIVQSQLLTADVGRADPAQLTMDTADAGKAGEAGPNRPLWSLSTDYTVAASLATAQAITDRPRLAVVLNGDDAGHQIYVRTRGTADQQPVAAAASLPPAIGDTVRNFRKVLASAGVAPTSSAQNRNQLITALRTLAPLGWQLYAAMFSGLRDVLLDLGPDDPTVLHIARPAGVTLSVPWALVYGIPLYQAAQQLPVCPLVQQWDGRSPLITGEPTACPHAATVSHASNLLCPFGFLGFRHDIEQLSTTEQPVMQISAGPGSSVVIAETAYEVDAKALAKHTADVQAAVGRLPGVRVDLASGKAQLKQLISRDLPLVYFFCHGERPNAGSPETYLGIGKRELITPADFVGWIQEAYFTQQLRVWNQVRPLVFINACHSAELDPAALFNYIDVFVSGGNAAGVIGTEVKVAQQLAMDFAGSFFDQLLTPGVTVATALRRARLQFLAQGNIFGLNYTPYCWADLTFAP